MLPIYADQTVHPRSANKLMKGVTQALADGNPEAIATYFPDLVLKTSAAARTRVPFALFPMYKNRRSVRRGTDLGLKKGGR
eukprot:13113619-Alexandrium_andersonii.AAC.1